MTSAVSSDTMYGYEIISTLGDGAGSTIYAVTDPDSSQIFALKHVRRVTDKHERFIDQLVNEHEVATKVAHSNLRRVIDLKLTRTLLRKVTEAALVMELFDGEPLDELDRLSMPQQLDVFIQVGHALDALHRAGYVHCDLKPNNILVSYNLTAKLIDLGQACPIGTAKERIQGTPDFMAPEQARCLPVTPRTDIFNFGATMYYALTCEKLPTLFTTQKQKGFLLESRIPTPQDLNPKVPAPLSNLIMDCVRADPSKRPGNIADITNRLEVIHFSLQKSPRAA